jgi:DNA polymerase-4
MNSYFASVEQQANPFLRGRPIGVTGKRSERSVVAAASIEAKKLGVKTAMSTWEAKRICPSIILVAGDPEKYSEITARFNKIFRDFTDRVEQFSVDESFLDVSERTEDYLGAILIAQSIKARLRDECGERITASIGVGPNRLLAKLASERVKPNGLTVCRPEQAIELLDASDLQDVCGIGPRIARRLENLGLTTFKRIREYPIELLIEEFKSYGLWLHNAAYGRDVSEVTPDEEPPKSMGHSYTLPKDTWDRREITHYLLGLSDKVGWRLRRDGYVARCVTAYVRYGDFSGDGQQHRFHEPTADGLKLFQIAWHMIKRWIRRDRPVRLVGISAGMLAEGPEPPALFLKDRKMTRTMSALDRIQRRYGEGSWTRAALLHTKFQSRSSGFHYDHEI